MATLRGSPAVTLVVTAAIAAQLFASAARAQDMDSPPSVQAPTFDPSPLPPDGGPGEGPVVTLQADRPFVYLQQLRMKWTPVCSAPCQLTLDPNRSYRVTGHSLLATGPFRLPRRSGEVRVVAKMGGKAARIVGFIVLGAGAGLVGVGALVADPINFVNPGEDSSGPDVNQDNGTAGHRIMIVGGLVAVIGLTLAAFSGSTVDVQ